MTETQVLEELKAIRKDVDYIKEHMIETMTEEDEQLLEEALQDHAKGKTITLSELDRDVHR